MPKRSPRRWLVFYAVTLVALTMLAIWAPLQLSTYRSPALDFYALQPGEYYITNGLTRRQAGSLKLGFAESYDAPAIGAFGNHIINFFGSEAFGEPERAETFFNYSYANLSLPEMLRFLRHLERRGRLPGKLMIVAVTPPNADNGRFIIDHGNELPPDILLEDAFQSGGETSIASKADALWRLFEVRLHELFNYNTLILGLTGRERQARMTGPFVCAAGRPQPARAWFARLPWTLRMALAPYLVVDLCEAGDWGSTLKRDGSVNLSSEQPDQRINENDLGEDDRGLRAGDEAEIARNLEAIDAIGRRNGVKVVFLITPVLETDRHDSIVNQIFDRALALAPQIEIIDHRGLHDDPSLILDYLHPTPAYYARVAEEIRRRGLLDEQPPDPSAE